MIRSPGIRLTIHALLVLCISYRTFIVNAENTLLKETEEADRLAALTTENDLKSTTESTIINGSTQSTESTRKEITDDSTDFGYSTTAFPIIDVNVTSTEGFGNESCIWNVASNKCVLEGTSTECNPCDAFDCGTDQRCVSNTTCLPSCECTNDNTIIKEGVCVDPCQPNPCQHDQPCRFNATANGSFECNCTADYDGQLCETAHNYCYDVPPAKCPTGAHECIFHGVGNYSCKCADGHVHNTQQNTCLKVSQLIVVKLEFNSTFYSEEYNIEGNKMRDEAVDDIEKAMRGLYNESLIAIDFGNFTQGSLIAHYNISLDTSCDPEENVWSLMRRVTDCATNPPPSAVCFDQLGKPFLPMDGAISQDLRCVDVYCPQGTECQPTVKSAGSSVRCICSAGFNLTKTVTEDSGRQVDVCEDFDECVAGGACNDGELCVNTPGSFTCTPSPCEKNPCPGNAVCTAIDEHAFTCQCDWIYIASDCGTPWPLILLIIACVLLVLLILTVVGLLFLFTRSKQGSSVIASTSF